MRIQRLSVSEQIFNDICSKIKSGEIKPGAKLVIAGIQKEYAVSSTPVRDALNQLHSAGFVELAGSSTATVAEMDSERMASILELYDELNDMSFRIIMRRNMIGQVSQALHEIYAKLLSLKDCGSDGEIVDTFVTFINTPGAMTGNLYYLSMIKSLQGKFVVAFGDYRKILTQDQIYAISGAMIDALDRQDYDAFQSARGSVYDCFRRKLESE